MDVVASSPTHQVQTPRNRRGFDSHVERDADRV